MVIKNTKCNLDPFRTSYSGVHVSRIKMLQPQHLFLRLHQQVVLHYPNEDLYPIMEIMEIHMEKQDKLLFNR